MAVPAHTGATRQPQFGGRVNRLSPFSKGLVFLTGQTAGGWVDLVSGQFVAQSWTPTFHTTRRPQDKFLRYRKGSAQVTFGAPTGLDRIAGPYTLFADACLETNASFALLFGTYEAGAGNGVRLFLDDVNTVVDTFYSNTFATGNRHATTCLGTNSHLVAHRIMFTADGANFRYYAGGALVRTIALTDLPALHVNRRTLIGTSGLSTGAAWNRVLTLADYQRLYDNPSQLYAPVRKLRPAHLTTITSTAYAPVGLAAETDTALALSGASVLATGMASEADTALALAAVQIKATGLASETDTALPLAGVQLLAVGLAAEADTALALAGLQLQSTGMAVEADTAFALAPGSAPGAIGIAVETDTAFALGGVQIAPAGLAAETDAALSLTAVQVSPTGLAFEADSALALAAMQIGAVGLASEVDTAFALSNTMGGPVGLASEADTAFALDAVQKMLVGMAVETDTALAPGGSTEPAVGGCVIFGRALSRKKFVVKRGRELLVFDTEDKAQAAHDAIQAAKDATKAAERQGQQVSNRAAKRAAINARQAGAEVVLSLLASAPPVQTIPMAQAEALANDYGMSAALAQAMRIQDLETAVAIWQELRDEEDDIAALLELA